MVTCRVCGRTVRTWTLYGRLLTIAHKHQRGGWCSGGYEHGAELGQNGSATYTYLDRPCDTGDARALLARIAGTG